MPVSGKQVVAALQRRGWTIIRVNGSHHVMRSPDGTKVVVPIHGNRDLTRRMLAALLRDTGLRREDL